MNEVPTQFDDEFLDWFRDRTEHNWSQYRPTSFADYVARRVGGVDWQHGTRWLGGMSASEIDQAERQHSICFPPDHRLFLSRLHAVDRPMRGARYTDYVEGGEESHLVPYERPAFYNWLADTDDLRRALDWPLEGLLFDIEYNGHWLPSWGTKPATLEGQLSHVRKLAAAGPRLIPIFQHRYLPSEPNQVGNPVLSIYQSDIVLYAPNLRSYFLSEFSSLLGLEAKRDLQSENMAGAENTAKSLPFWGEIYTWNNSSL